jgi:ubiquinone/menaquinone biosynthesis C-methylase UbiE
MRLASQQLLRKYPNFTSVAATAEETTLTQQSINLITAGQAFGWFDRKKSRAEFTRILKSDGWVALAWNIPQDNTPFLAAYNKSGKSILMPSHITAEWIRSLSIMNCGLGTHLDPSTSKYSITLKW